LLALGALAFAQPLFELLAANPEFFPARGGERADVLFVVAAALLLAPLPWLGAAFAARRRLAGDTRERAPATLVGSLVGLVALRAAALGALPAGGALAVAGAAAAAAGLAYRRTAAARLLATALTPAVVVVPALFLMSPGISRRLEPPRKAIPLHASGGRVPVVWIVFDELSLASLLDSTGAIDRERFPHFGALAGEATWFRQAVAPSPETATALPAILSGRVGAGEHRLQHERNLFTLLGDYPTWAVEPFSTLCPAKHNLLVANRAPELPERARRLLADLPVIWAQLVAPAAWRPHLPSIADAWQGFAVEERGRGERRRGKVGMLGRRPDVQRFVGSIAPASRALYLGHLMLPHIPWEHLPSGRTYPCRPDCHTGTIEAERWRAAHLYQRYVLQLGYADRLLGEIVARLRRADLYDRALLVVLADHGTSFQAGMLRRTTATPTLGEVLGVPLLVKRPGQREGEVADALVSTADLPATVADVVGVTPPWPLPGRSLFAPGARPAPVYLSSAKTLETFHGDLAALTGAARDRLAALAGPDGLRDPFRIGPWPALLGRPAAPLVRPGPDDRVEAALDHPDRWEDVEPAAAEVPLLVTGTLDGAAPGDGCCSLALAVGGTIRATTHSFWNAQGEHRFGALLPEDSLRRGPNQLALFRVDVAGRSLSAIRRRRRARQRAAAVPGATRRA
jgi:hypothetical protein